MSKRERRRLRHQSVPPPPPPVPIAAGDLPLIKIVGISGSGKSTLVHALRQAGYNARPISQEHSNVHDLWQQFDRATLLIYLNTSEASQHSRRPDVTWDAAAFQDEKNRLAHAWDHADLRIDTAGLTPAAVLQVALAYLTRRKIRHANGPLLPIPATGSAEKRPPPPPAA